MHKKLRLYITLLLRHIILSKYLILDYILGFKLIIIKNGHLYICDNNEWGSGSNFETLKQPPIML